jgi:hypothetical protein
MPVPLASEAFGDALDPLFEDWFDEAFRELNSMLPEMFSIIQLQ